MGFLVHTLRSEESCANFGQCQNNLTSLELLVQDNLVIRDVPTIGENERGLFVGFSRSDFICTYGGEVKRGGKVGMRKKRYLMQLGTTTS